MISPMTSLMTTPMITPMTTLNPPRIRLPVLLSLLVGLTFSFSLKATELADEEDIASAELPPSAAATESMAASADLPPEHSEASAPVAVVPALTMLGHSVNPGELVTMSWSPGQSFPSIDTPVPVLVARGTEPGPAVCLTAAIHGDELNGIEMVRRLMYQLKPQNMSGTVIGIPIVNLDGFRRGSRYLSDRRDLNRHFPGRSTR